MRSRESTIIVTGGAQGIGKGLVAHFFATGWQVLFVDGDSEAGNETAEEYTGSCFIHGDLTQSGLAEHATSECLRRFGRLDALINNAGVSRFTPITYAAPKVASLPGRNSLSMAG